MRPQDAYKRGRDAVDDATDSFDSIDWLVKNLDNTNKKVGMWGSSYPGYYTSVATINSHKALKAVSPQAPIADWFFDDFHRNGAFVTPMAFLFFDSFDKQRDGPKSHRFERNKLPTPDGYEFFKALGPLSNVNKHHFKGERPFWNEIIEHPNYDDYWQARSVLPHLNNTKPATLVVGGWFDTEDLYGPLNTYQAMSKNNRNDHVNLVMGPWSHGQWYRNSGRKLGDVDFGFNTGHWFQDNIQLPFFKHHLKGDKAPKLSQATMFETGANRWRQFDQWPPKYTSNKTLHLAANELLSSKAATQASTGHSEYISDPNKPVPFSASINSGWNKPYMVEDQRFAARRTDVLVFNADAATQDTTIAGPVKIDLWLSTSQSAADIVVKLIDVYPGKDANTNKADKENGDRHQLVRWGVIRGRFRDSFSEPKAFTPNKPTRVTFNLDDVLHTIKRGHKLQIQIQSSFFPFIDINPQKYVDNIFEAKAEDFVKATHKVYHNNSHQSKIEFTTLD
jgi:putative CocE/NonD family hydrolase